MKYLTIIRKSKLNNGKTFYSYIREHNAGEVTLIDYDTTKLKEIDYDRWYSCEINVKNDKIIDIIIK